MQLFRLARCLMLGQNPKSVGFLIKMAKDAERGDD